MKFSEIFEYKEEDGSTFESNGQMYDINKLFEISENLPIIYFKTDTLSWVLKYDNPDIENRNDIDYNIPILVGYDDDYLLVVDGVHRLKKAVKENKDFIAGKFIDSAMLNSSKIN